MTIRDLVAAAVAALSSRPLRSVLTTLGIVIAVAAIIAVTSVVQGLQRSITSELRELGATWIMITPESPRSGMRRARPLTWDDAEAIVAGVPAIELVAPQIGSRGTAGYGAAQCDAQIVAATDAYQDVTGRGVERGRHLSHLDLARRANVAVVGRTVVAQLGLGDDPVGREIRVGRHALTVIGVLRKQGQLFGHDADDQIVVPYGLARVVLGGRATETTQLVIRAAHAGAVERARDGAARVLRARHAIDTDDDDDFRILAQDEMLRTMTDILGGVTAVMAAVVGVALVVGGIGIMNIMLVSVAERTSEIGLRKALGARPTDIFAQFVVEAAILAACGGAVGVVLGYLTGMLLFACLPDGFGDAYVPAWGVVLAVGCAALTGVVFGSGPAARAAALEPIAALRHE